MTTAEIITMPTPLSTLGERIRTAFARTEHGRQEWIDGTIELALALFEARGRFPDNRAFSVWLAENDLDFVSQNDRAALINMAADIVVFRNVMLEQDDKLAPDTIWRKCSDRFTVGKLPNNTPLPAIPADSPSTPPQIESGPTKPSVSAVDKPEPARPVPELTRKHPFHGFKRGEEVAAIFVNRDAPARLAKLIDVRGGGKIWDLILEAIDADLVAPTQGIISTASLRMVFPETPPGYAQRFDLNKPADRKEVKDKVIPALIANRAAFKANPADIERIVNRHWQAGRDEARQAAAVQKITAAGQQKIVVFGEVMWPNEQGLYDYDQLRCAIWLVTDLRVMINVHTVQSPGSQGDYLKTAMVWLNEYIARIGPDAPAHKVQRVLAVVQHIGGLMQRNPTGECMLPYSPKVEGEW